MPEARLDPLNVSNSPAPASAGGNRREIRRVLLTGALGDVGSRVAPALQAEFDLLRTDLAPAEKNATDYLAADLTDFSAVIRLLEGVDAVVHSAVAQGSDPTPGLPLDQMEPAEARMLAVNPAITFHILEAARRLGLARVVYLSSLTIVLGNRHLPHYEPAMPPTPTNLYACTKLFGEHLADVYWRNHGLSTISLRLGQPTPINHRFDDLWKTNRRARSTFVHIDDVARGLIAALRTDCPHGVFNLVSANDNPRVEIETTCRALGYQPQAFFGPSGLSFHPDGNFPPNFPPPEAPITTHLPGEEEFTAREQENPVK